MDKILGLATKPQYIKIGYDELTKKDARINPQEFINEVLYWCRAFSFRDLTHLKLQKLLYYCYAIAMWNTEYMPFAPFIDAGEDLTIEEKEAKPLFDRKRIDFWQFGPVIPVAYLAFKNYGSNVLAQSFEEYDKLFLKEDPSPNEDVDDVNLRYKFKKYEMKSNTQLSKLIRNSIQYTLIALGDLNAHKLVDMTHSKESAWSFLYDAKDRDKMKKSTSSFVIKKIIEEIAFYNFFEDLYEQKKGRYN